jgi:hypothetical protein
MKSFKQYLNEASLKSVARMGAIAAACIGGACATPQQTAHQTTPISTITPSTPDESWKEGLSPEQQREVQKRVEGLKGKSDAEAARRAKAMTGINPRSPSIGSDQPFADPSVRNPRDQGFIHDKVKGTWVPAPGLRFRGGGSSSAGR